MLRLRLAVAASAAALAATAVIVPAGAQQRGSQPAAPAAPAAPAQPAAPAPAPTIVTLKGEPSQADWVKVCGSDPNTRREGCIIARDFVSEQGQPVLGVVISEQKGEAQRSVRFALPVGMLLQPGVRFGVDSTAPVAGRYQICFPNACFADANVPEAFINGLKRGTNMNISMQNQVGREVTFQVPLVGFGKAYDGAPIDPKVLEEQQRRLQDGLQARQEEMRRRMEQQNPGAAPPTGGAPAPTAAPGAPAAPAAPAAPRQ